jgi:hypothetical protein
MGKGAEGMIHFNHVVQELYHIHDLAGGYALVLAFQQTGIVDLDECRTTHGGGYDIVELLELVLKLFCQGDGLSLKAGIGHRLSAAGLVEWIFHVKPQMLQQSVCGHTHLGIYHIYITGNK